MNEVRCQISVSLDGFVAGPNQSHDNPIGEGGMRLHEWAFRTLSWRAQQGLDGGEHNADAAALPRPRIRTRSPPPRALSIKGGTTFTFVADGIQSALEQARTAAGEKHVAIAGATAERTVATGLSGTSSASQDTPALADRRWTSRSPITPSPRPLSATVPFLARSRRRRTSRQHARHTRQARTRERREHSLR